MAKRKRRSAVKQIVKESRKYTRQQWLKEMLTKKEIRDAVSRDIVDILKKKAKK